MRPKPIIIAIVGESGSGKTSLSMFLQERANIPAIVSYTTRPMREGEQHGVDHFFVTHSQVPEPCDTFAYTVFGEHEYWTRESQFRGYRIVSYVVDEKGLLEMLERWSESYTIVSVLIQRPDNPVEESRRLRDRGRIHISPESYDAVIVNNGTEKDFHRQAIFKIGNLVSRNWSWE